MTTINRSAMLVLGLVLVLLVAGQAAAQTFGTKVEAGDPDVGFPLSAFSAIGPTPAIPGGFGVFPQTNAFVSYWDIGTTPGEYDDKDVVYLQFGGSTGTAARIVRESNIRLTGWGAYTAGSKVKAGDSDIGQQVVPWALQVWTAAIPTLTGFYYINVAGGSGYDLGDPVYLKLESPPAGVTTTNDVRITASFAGLAGSKVSNSDPDAGLTLVAFDAVPPLGPLGGPIIATAGPAPIAQLAFFNTNGNVNIAGLPIYDEPDLVYFDIQPICEVSPNDVRLF